MMGHLGSIFKGSGGEFEINRVIGAFGATAYIVCANVFVGYDIFVKGRDFDLTAYCLAFPAGLGVAVGAIAGAVALKDRNVAKAKTETAAAAVVQAEAEGPVMIPVILLNLAGRFGLTGVARKVVGAAIGIVGILALLGAVWALYEYYVAQHDYTVIQQDRAVSNAEIRNSQISAERQAGADKAVRDDQFATNQTEIKEQTDAAAANGNSPLDALFGRLR